jgi:hypothetical protein
METRTKDVDVKEKFEESELKKLFPSLQITKTNSEILNQIVNQWESWDKLIKMTAFILRFGYKGSKRFRGKSISVQELRETELFLTRKAQETDLK